MPDPEQAISGTEGWTEEKIEPNSAEWTADRPWRPSCESIAPPRWRRGRALINLKSWLWPEQSSRSKRLHPTAYLDGLRGFAAFLVYWHHHNLWVHASTGQNPIFENGFGYAGNHYMVSFPFLRTLFSGGHYAVSTFFVISGYVLSIKPLAMIQTGNMVGLGDHLASALFRRWIRLFLPLVAVMVLYAMSWHMLGVWVSNAESQGSWRAELWALYTEFKNFSFVFKEGGEPWLSYNRHLWSIPAEFRGSIVVYTSILAFSRCSLVAHLWCQVGLTFYFMYIADGWYCAMFTAGALLRHLDLLAESDELPRFLARLEPIKTFIYYHLLVFSILLGGVPSENNDVDQLAKNRGWYLLSFLKPQAVFDYKWFYLFWAAVFLVSSTPRIHWLKSFFETRFCQHLGRVSYALYLIHGPVLSTVGDRLYVAMGWHLDHHSQHIPHWVDRLPVPRKGPLGLELSFLVPHIIILPLTLLLAELITRMIDTPSVKFASWMYGKVSDESTTMKQAKA